jgi:hypothetical protein
VEEGAEVKQEPLENEGQAVERDEMVVVKADPDDFHQSR